VQEGVEGSNFINENIEKSLFFRELLEDKDAEVKFLLAQLE